MPMFAVPIFELSSFAVMTQQPAHLRPSFQVNGFFQVHTWGDNYPKAYGFCWAGTEKSDNLVQRIQRRMNQE
jgi:hypothetical protein